MMTADEAKKTFNALDTLEDVMDTVTGDTRAQLAYHMQQIADLTGQSVNLETCRKELAEEAETKAAILTAIHN